MISENKNPANQETHRLTLSVVIVADHIHDVNEVGSPALLLSKVATIAELSNTMQSCVESHKQTAMVKIVVTAVVEVAIADMVDLAVGVTSYTISM